MLISTNEIPDDFVRAVALYFDDYAIYSTHKEQGYLTSTTIPIPIGAALQELAASGRLRHVYDDSGPQTFIANVGTANITDCNFDVNPVLLADFVGHIESKLLKMSRVQWVVSPNLVRGSEGTERTEPFLQLEIARSFVVPKQGTPVEKILRFRERRSAEFEAFWTILNSSIQGVDADWRAGQIHVSVVEIEKYLRELERSLDEPWISRAKRSAFFEFKLEASLRDLLVAGATAATTQLLYNNVVMTAMSGLTAGGISLIRGGRNIRAGVNLLPPRRPVSDQAQAMTFAYEARKLFDPPKRG